MTLPDSLTLHMSSANIQNCWPQPAGLAKVLILMLEKESFNSLLITLGSTGTVFATLVLILSPCSRNWGSELEVIMGSAKTVPSYKHLPPGKVLDVLDAESPPGLGCLSSAFFIQWD